MRKDSRLKVFLLGLALIGGLGILIDRLPSKVDLVRFDQQSDQINVQEGNGAVHTDTPVSSSAPPVQVIGAASGMAMPSTPGAREVHERFQQGVLMLHAKEYEYAFSAFHRVLQLAPKLPEAHVNIGFALLGLERYEEAWSFFNTATELNPRQANAYYGMAVSLEKQGKLRPALEAMQAYLHVEKSPSVYTRRAQSAVWEMEAKLGLGPWGESRGVPPGYSEEAILRNQPERGRDAVQPGQASEESDKPGAG